MGERLSNLFVTKPRALARGAPRAATLRAPSTEVLDAGVLASFGTAAFVGVLAVGLKLNDATTHQPAATQPTPDPTPAHTDLARVVEIPLAEVEEPALVQPIAYRPTETRPASAMTEFPSLPPQPTNQTTTPNYGDPLVEYLAHEEVEPIASHVVYVAPQIDIRRPRYGDGETVLAVATTRRAPVDQNGLRGAATEILQDVTTAWQAPGMRDLSFYVASGDEAISWSFTEASPNHGAVAYQDARVEVGEASAGIALSLDSAQVALAHVQTQDVSFWGQRQEEDYSGVILTMKF